MNQKLSYTFKGMLLFLACLATTGCSREEMLTPETPADSRPKVELAFSASPDLTTRTTLPGPDNLQHVREVQLYIFNGTENTAMCVASEVVDWTDIAAPDEGRPTASKKYPVQYKSFEADKPYTFLAIGLDDRSGDTYNLPKAVEVNTTTLANAKAILATGKTRQDIAVSELFGGSIVLTPDANNTVTGTIDLYRRVAGVMGWFKNIPQQVNGTDVASLRIELYKAQNKSIWLSKPQTGEDVIMDPIEETDDDNKILVQIDLTEDDFQQDKVISKGSYVLPMIAPFASEEEMRNAGYDDADIYVKDYTLRVVLADNAGNILQAKRVKDKEADADGDTSGGTGVIITGNAYRFPINANWFYPIGTKENPVEWPEEGDNNIVITVNPNWEGVTELPLE